MQIQTDCLTIRPFTSEDIDSFMEYRNNEEWMRYQGFKGLDKKTYEERLLQPPEAESGMQLAIADTDTGGLIGDIYLKKFGTIYWLGYTIHPKHARRGYASEAARGIIEWARRGGAEKILAGVLPGNTASVRLLEKLDFRYMGEEEGEYIYFLDLLKCAQ